MNVKEIQKIIEEKVIGVWEPCHDDYGHRYRNTKTSQVQRSVTTKIGEVIAKNHLIPWSIKVAAEYLLQGNRLNQFATERFRNDIIKGMQLAPFDKRDSAGNIGSRTHDALERYINQFIADGIRPNNILDFMLPDSDPRSIASARAAEQWFLKNNVIPIVSELLVGNIKLSSGTLDFLAIVNGRLTLVDHKTSNQIDKEGYSMQVSAYQHFFQEMTGIKIQDCKILLLSKDYDKYEIWKIKDTKKHYKAFKNVCALYDWKHDKKEKIIKDIKRITI